MKTPITLTLLLFTCLSFGQTNPAITGWLQNTTGITGRHYIAGNSTPIDDDVQANVQSVEYNTNYAYVSATGIPAYITGPFQDKNPSLATAQNSIFRIPLNPTENTGNPTATAGGNIGVFINGVALFDFRDGVAWNNSTQSLCGGPGRDTCSGGPQATQEWNRDAVPAEMEGFDCNKAHPANGNYHHHQNPSAFNLDINVLYNVCDTYPADGLYVINKNEHSPLIGFAYDGFPIYGAYGYANTDGTGGIVRIKSGYQLRSNTTRTNGPDVSTTYFNGYFREDYEHISNADTSYLDEHNGRFCITPEYPDGMYCYFATVDENHNSAYPYAVGPTYYGNKVVTTVTSLPNNAVKYEQTLGTASFEKEDLEVIIAPNPAQDFIAIQTKMTESDLTVQLINDLGQVIKTSTIRQGSTLSILETDTIYNGLYFVKISNANGVLKTAKVTIKK